jgi:hypothetical protein
MCSILLVLVQAQVDSVGADKCFQQIFQFLAYKHQRIILYFSRQGIEEFRQDNVQYMEVRHSLPETVSTQLSEMQHYFHTLLY